MQTTRKKTIHKTRKHRNKKHTKKVVREIWLCMCIRFVRFVCFCFALFKLTVALRFVCVCVLFFAASFCDFCAF